MTEEAPELAPEEFEDPDGLTEDEAPETVEEPPELETQDPEAPADEPVEPDAPLVTDENGYPA